MEKSASASFAPGIREIEVLTPELSVVIVTYNHAAFIETAIESVLMQDTSFEYEVVISEDCSTDGTREIVQRMAGSNPERIRLLLSAHNLNDNSVVRRGLEAARGRYVALLDGDDFWTSREKLQRQVDVLDAHPEYSVCFHNATVLYEDGSIPAHPFLEELPSHRLSTAKPEPVSGLRDIVRGDYIPTCSAVLRIEGLLPLPAWYDGAASGDWPLHVLGAQRGDLAYLDETLATYRVHAGGVWTMQQSLYRTLSDVEKIADVYVAINQHLECRFDAEVTEELANLYEATAVAFYRAGEYGSARVCAWRCLRRRPAALSIRRWRPGAVLALSAVRGTALGGLR